MRPTRRARSLAVTEEPMRWQGVGPRMGLVLTPWLAIALWMRVWAADASAIPFLPERARVVLGATLLAMGLAFWAWSAIYFVRHFFAGRLLTGGPFAWCRHPIYASFIVGLVPAAALLADAWPLLAMDVVLYTIFRSFIGDEDRMLAERFGDTYATYRAAVGELVPLPPRLRAVLRSIAEPASNRGHADTNELPSKNERTADTARRVCPDPSQSPSDCEPNPCRSTARSHPSATS